MHENLSFPKHHQHPIIWDNSESMHKDAQGSRLDIKSSWLKLWEAEHLVHRTM
jgi:hypothetical protein